MGAATLTGVDSGYTPKQVAELLAVKAGTARQIIMGILLDIDRLSKPHHKVEITAGDPG